MTVNLCRHLLILITLFSLVAIPSSASLSGAGDDFIEEIFEVKIPGLVGAYNASIVEYEEGYLMAFRYDTYIDFDVHFADYCQYIGIIRLDENFQPQGPWYPCLGYRTYDPRLLNIDGTIYLIFASANATDAHSHLSSHLEMCTLQFTKDGIEIDSLLELSAPCQQKWEKNWAPFTYKNKIHLSYTIDPHLVLRPSLIDGTCEIISNNNKYIYWPYGIIRGGTPAKLVDGQYLAFFHSSIFSHESQCINYYVGAYIYSAKPPFNLLKISTKPFSQGVFTKISLQTFGLLTA